MEELYMKRLLVVLIAAILTCAMLAGCSSDTPAASQKSEEELRAEIQAEMESEAKMKEEMEAEIREKLEAEQQGNEANEANEVNEVNEGEQKPQETNAPSQQAQEEPKETEQPKTTEQPKEIEQPKATGSALIESDQSAGYYKYKANTSVKFDIDMDGKDEDIKYDSTNGKLSIPGYEALNIDTMFAQTDYFIIIKFKDKYSTEMNMIGILDYGPSNDPTTSLYSIIEPMEEKWFGFVGSVEGEIVPPSKYEGDISLDGINDPKYNAVMEHFNYKAVLRKGEGIEAPVRLSILPHATWFGRNLFTYYSTYKLLIDNIEKYNQDYETKIVLNIQNDVKAYSEKDVNSQSTTIKAGQAVFVLATDNNEWIGMVAEDGSEGWVLAKDVSDKNFSGFPVFD